MELALYCPLCGYYEKKEDTPGRRGDFYTSVSVGPLFGELLAFQFAEWFAAAAPPPSPLNLLEAGAHDGRLAKDVLGWLQHHRPEDFPRIQYTIIEPSPTRRAWQEETLRAFAGCVRWLNTAPPPNSQSNAIFFSNELIDAFPVHRVTWDAKLQRWFEWGVVVTNDRFGWQRMEMSSLQLDEILPDAPSLPDGFTTEVCPAAATWWRNAAASLQSGKLLTFDYGLDAEDYFSPMRSNGTLRAYRQHRLVADVLAAPGEQDLTAHVNLSALRLAGESAGGRTEALSSQAQFLTKIAAKAWQPDSGFGEWTRERTRQFQTLTHPEFLGRTFRVLIQSRGERNS